MKRGTGIGAAILLLLLSVTVEAWRPGDVVLEWTGTYLEDDGSRHLTGKCSATGCVGDLVSCDGSRRIIITKLTYSFVSDVCDDDEGNPNALPPCNGRFTALAEECRGSGDIVRAGALTTVNSAGAIRVCLDGGDCSGPQPGTVIATGTIRSQRRSNQQTVSVSGNSSMARTIRSSFLFEGEQHTLRLWRTHFDDFTAERNDGHNCGGGCAVMGVSVKDQKQ